MFCRGEDGYNITIPKFDPTKNQADKKICQHLAFIRIES